MVAGVTFVSKWPPGSGCSRWSPCFQGTFRSEIGAFNRCFPVQGLGQFRPDRLQRFVACGGGNCGLRIFSFPLLTCIEALVIWHFREKISSFTVRGLAEGDRFHVSGKLTRRSMLCFVLSSHCVPEPHFEQTLVFHRAEVQGFLVYPLLHPSPYA